VHDEARDTTSSPGQRHHADVVDLTRDAAHLCRFRLAEPVRPRGDRVLLIRPKGERLKPAVRAGAERPARLADAHAGRSADAPADPADADESVRDRIAIRIHDTATDPAHVGFRYDQLHWSFQVLDVDLDG